jgi:hypothetical protein
LSGSRRGCHQRNIVNTAASTCIDGFINRASSIHQLCELVPWDCVSVRPKIKIFEGNHCIDTPADFLIMRR